MEPTGIWIEKCKYFINDEIQRNSYSLGWVVGYIQVSAVNGWSQAKGAFRFPRNQKFSQELEKLLALKLKKMSDLTLPDKVFEKLASELYKLLLCSLASNRTPDEVIDGLQNDIEMRAEVVELMLSQTGTDPSYKDQRVFLDGVLSGDADLRALLNKQMKKKGFPYNI